MNIRDIAGGAKDILVGTLRNMSPNAVEARMRAGDAARAAETARMIRENFGSEERYRANLGLDTPEGKALFTPPYQTAMQELAKRIQAAHELARRGAGAAGRGIKRAADLVF